MIFRTSPKVGFFPHSHFQLFPLGRAFVQMTQTQMQLPLLQRQMVAAVPQAMPIVGALAALLPFAPRVTQTGKGYMRRILQVYMTFPARDRKIYCPISAALNAPWCCCRRPRPWTCCRMMAGPWCRWSPEGWNTLTSMILGIHGAGGNWPSWSRICHTGTRLVVIFLKTFLAFKL